MQPRLRLLLRTSSLVCAVLPFLSFTEWPTAMACVAAVSPFISLSAALGGRTLSLTTAACLPLVILAFLKQRWFCWNLCPTGFLLELASFRRRDERRLIARFPNLANWLLFLGIGMAAAGYPLLMAFDPLSILSGFLSTWQWRNPGFAGSSAEASLEWSVFIPALPFLGLIVLNIIRPNLWCRRLCPLGAAQHFLGMAGRPRPKLCIVAGRPRPKLCIVAGRPRPKLCIVAGRPRPKLCPPTTLCVALRAGIVAGRRFHPPQAQNSVCSAGTGQSGESSASFSRQGVNRRFFLLTLSGGIAGLILAPKKSGAVVSFIRPPGSVNENIFTGLCTRCGNCINVCPESIIFPDFGSSGISGFLTPILRFRGNYCNEWCFKCVDSCPTGAIRRISLAQKRLTAIGTSRINKSLCLAWTYKQDCVVCQEFCPYQAIAIVKNGGVNCPEVNEALCRGCGACQSQCPAIPAKAITVRGLSSQRTIKPDIHLD